MLVIKKPLSRYRTRMSSDANYVDCEYLQDIIRAFGVNARMKKKQHKTNKHICTFHCNFINFIFPLNRIIRLLILIKNGQFYKTVFFSFEKSEKNFKYLTFF